METNIKLLKPLYIDGTTIQAGQTKVVNELHARELVKKGYAVLITEPVKPNTPSPPDKTDEVVDAVQPEIVIENTDKEESIPVEPKKENTTKKQK